MAKSSLLLPTKIVLNWIEFNPPGTRRIYFFRFNSNRLTWSRLWSKRLCAGWSSLLGLAESTSWNHLGGAWALCQLICFKQRKEEKDLPRFKLVQIHTQKFIYTNILYFANANHSIRGDLLAMLRDWQQDLQYCSRLFAGTPHAQSVLFSLLWSDCYASGPWLEWMLCTSWLQNKLLNIAF